MFDRENLEAEARLGHIRAMAHEIDPLFRLVSFGLIDWANSPRLPQLEIRRPWVYRAIVYPPIIALIATYGAVIAWCLLAFEF